MPAITSVRLTAAAGAKSAFSKQTETQIGITESMQSMVPMILSLEEVCANAALRSRSIPATPYSVSNGSFARNSYSFAFAPAEIKSRTPIAASRIKAQRPMPQARFSLILITRLSLIAARKIKGAGEITQRKAASAIRGAETRRSSR